MANNPRRKGFSLRQSLVEQGVCEEHDMRQIIGRVYDLLPLGLDITRFRVSQG